MDIPTIITAATAIISVFIATFALIQGHKQYKDSVQPQLSMKLLQYNNMLYLQVKNTGGLAAKEIEINILEINNNGNANDLLPGALFKQPFELYPEEVVQDRIAYFGASIVDDAFPQIKLNAKYCVGKRKKPQEYKRTVTFVSAYAEKISADVNMNLGGLESSARSIARAAVRTANYLDGNKVAAFDELNIMSDKCLANDLHNALGQATEPIMSREETIDAALSAEKAGETNVHS